MWQQHRSKIIAAGVALVVILWMASGGFTGDSDTDPANTSNSEAAESMDENGALDQLDRVQVETLSAIAHPEQIQVSGRTAAARQSQISSEISGQVSEIMAQDGALLNAGDTIVTINIDDREAAVRSAENRVKQYEIEYRTAQRLLDRGFSTQVEVATKRAELESARATLNRAQLDLANTRVRAPFDGVLEQRMVEAGDYVQVGTQIAEFLDLDPIKVVGFVAEQRIGQVETGQEGRAILPNGAEHRGEISFVSRTADPSTRTFRVEMTVDNPDLKIADGLTARMVLDGPVRLAHRITPAVLTLNDVGSVGIKYVAQGKVAFQPVEITSSNPDAVWVTGLPDPVQVIVVGQDYVQVGQTVDAVEVNSDDAATAAGLTPPPEMEDMETVPEINMPAFETETTNPLTPFEDNNDEGMETP